MALSRPPRRTPDLLRAARSALRNTFGAFSGVAFDPLSPQALELELHELGLSGVRFGPPDYARDLAQHLGISILFAPVGPAAHPAKHARLVAAEHLAETTFLRRWCTAVIEMPTTLPCFLAELVAYHELSHIAAGDLVDGVRLSPTPPPADPREREEAADARARHLYIAGSLGPENPYALELAGLP